MKQSFDVRIILPEYLSMSDLVDIINRGLEKSELNFTKYHWHPLDNTEVEVVHDLKDYRIAPIFGKELMLEFTNEQHKINN